MRFAYRLAFHLKILDPVGDILNKIDRRQLCYWMEYLSLEPPEADRNDERAALHSAMLLNRLRMSEESEVFQPSELKIDWVKRSEPAKPKPPLSEKAEQDALILGIMTRFK